MAVVGSTSWRGVLRELGLVATSGKALRSARTRADLLGIDYTHFRGQRRWSEDRLRDAIAASAGTWTEVLARLDLDDVGAIPSLKGHAARLGIDVTHLASQSSSHGSEGPTVENLRRAGSHIAAAWFALSGWEVSWPLEPCRYDLLVVAEGLIRRIQVKTSTVRAGSDWKVYLSTSRRTRTAYDPSEIDAFFIVDGDLNLYLIPVTVVGGLHAIHLARYGEYRLPGLKPCTPATSVEVPQASRLRPHASGVR